MKTVNRINEIMGWKCEDLYECTQMVAFISEELPSGYNNRELSRNILTLYRDNILWSYTSIENIYDALIRWYDYRPGLNYNKIELKKFIKNEPKKNVMILLKNYLVYHLCQVAFPPFKKILQKERHQRFKDGLNYTYWENKKRISDG